jgi:hypothetical protein
MKSKIKEKNKSAEFWIEKCTPTPFLVLQESMDVEHSQAGPVQPGLQAHVPHSQVPWSGPEEKSNYFSVIKLLDERQGVTCQPNLVTLPPQTKPPNLSQEKLSHSQ